MFRLILKMLLPLAIIGGGYAYLMGGGIMGGGDILGFLKPAEDKPKGIEGLGNAVTDKNVTVYQWVDEHGQKHFSSTPPATNSPVKTVQLSPDTNVVKGFKAPEEEEKEEKRRPQVTSIGKLYTPEGVKDVVQDAQDVSNMLNERMAQQQEMMEQMSGLKKNR